MTGGAAVSETAGIVLAGGRSRRMGGADKALLDLGGRPLVAHLVARLATQVSALAISANGDPARFARFGVPVLPDPLPGFQGPLAGILAGLRWAARSGKSFVATVPADTPFVPRDLVARLRAGIGAAEIAVAASADGAQHPTVALWRASAAEDLSVWLERGDDRAVHAWMDTRGTAQVAFADTAGGDPFYNVNRPADLAEAARRLAKEEE